MYTTKTVADNWDGRSKLYLLTLLKDKAGDQAFAHFNQSYRAAVAANTVGENPLILDLVSKYFGEASHYDFAAFLELVQGPMSEYQKAENLYSGNKAVYPLASLLSEDNLKAARKDIKLDSKWGLVSNDQIEKYKLTKTMDLDFSINDFSQIKGKVLRIKDGADVVREIKITTPTMTLKDMPIGIYSLDIPTGVSRFYEPSSNYLAVSDHVSNAVIQMDELKTSTIAEENMVFKGLGNVIFARATVDAEKNSFELDVTRSQPHVYFDDEYASVEVLDDQGKSLLKKVMNGGHTATEKLQTTIKPGYTIRVAHREADRFSMSGTPANLVNTGSLQIFKVTKYGLTSDITGVTAQAALDNYKAKLVNFATMISSNNTFKQENYINLKTKLRKGIDYLPDADKATFQENYADLFVIDDDTPKYFMDGEQFEFEFRGHNNWSFAALTLDLQKKQAVLTQKMGEANGNFAGMYASASIYDEQGKLVYERKFNGRGYVPGYVPRNMKIDEGYYIKITHEEYENRLTFTNLETKETIETKKQATYKVMAKGLLEMPEYRVLGGN